jgi:hypothetical protein
MDTETTLHLDSPGYAWRAYDESVNVARGVLFGLLFSAPVWLVNVLGLVALTR